MHILSANKIQEIEYASQDVISDAYRSYAVIPPINLSKIIQQVGLSIKFGNFKNADIDGAYERSSKTVFISKSAPYVRQAFTIAHELGHYFLHSNKKIEIFYGHSLFAHENNRQEQEAHCFAASLLMPKNIILKYMQAIQNIGHLACRFNVNHTLMLFRLEMLNI